MKARLRYTRQLVLATLGLLGAASAVSATVWNINPGGTGDAPTIQAAFDLAAPGDAIVLAPGTYQDDNTRSINGYLFQVSNTSAVAHMSAGVSITSSGGPEVTFLDGEGIRHGLVAADIGDCSVSGITFQRCRTNGSGGGVEKWGAGFLVYRSSVTIENNRFIDGVAINNGGGGGVVVQGGLGNIVRGNLFLRNTADDNGAGLDMFQTSGEVHHNTFVQNNALGQGGGALLINGTGLEVHHNIFAYNTTTGNGSAILCLNSNSVTSSCNLFWGNDVPVVTTCNIVIGQDENLEADPLFCDPANEDFTLMASSPAGPDYPSSCGLRGAYPVACGPVSIATQTWGKGKGMYR
ncbi:DUF5123 domain-containing protein [bacterium]|nr:DUF5123 domain-containing protein [bacterium]